MDPRSAIVIGCFVACYKPRMDGLALTVTSICRLVTQCLNTKLTRTNNFGPAQGIPDGLLPTVVLVDQDHENLQGSWLYPM